MTVHNLMEEMVRQCLKDILADRARYADCDEQCQSDAMAIALNRLPPRYVATAKGELYAKTGFGPQEETDIYRELTNALEKVLSSSRPSRFEQS